MPQKISLNKQLPQLANVKHEIHFIELDSAQQKQLAGNARSFIEQAGIAVKPNQRVVVQHFYEKAAGAAIHYAVVLSTNEGITAMCIHCNSAQPHM